MAVACGLAGVGVRNPSCMRRFINILAEDASTVAAWMVPRMRGVRGSGKYFKCDSISETRIKLPILTSLST